MRISIFGCAAILALAVTNAPTARAHHRHLHHVYPHIGPHAIWRAIPPAQTDQRVNAYINSEGEYIPSILDPSPVSDQ